MLNRGVGDRQAEELGSGVMPVSDLSLTFDDGPADDTDAILALLGGHGLFATFFVLGGRVAKRPQLVARASREGHTIGNHSWDHPDLRALPVDSVRFQLERTSDAIERACGRPPTVFRPPYGVTNEAVNEIAAGLGMQTVLWDVDTGDYARPGVDAIATAIATAPPGAIVLMHDGHAEGSEGRGQTVEALARSLSVT
jgi:peptidoglycan-N-acetylglucosamine deacetylase